MGSEAELAGLRAQKILKFKGSLSMYSFCVLRLSFSASFAVFYITVLTALGPAFPCWDQ